MLQPGVKQDEKWLKMEDQSRNMKTNEKGKLVERWGRKATGLQQNFCQLAGLPFNE